MKGTYFRRGTYLRGFTVLTLVFSLGRRWRWFISEDRTAHFLIKHVCAAACSGVIDLYGQFLSYRFDKASGTLHLLIKDFHGTATHHGYSGAHLYSLDGVKWNFTEPAFAYDTTNLWSDGVVRRQVNWLYFILNFAKLSKQANQPSALSFTPPPPTSISLCLSFSLSLFSCSSSLFPSFPALSLSLTISLPSVILLFFSSSQSSFISLEFSIVHYTINKMISLQLKHVTLQLKFRTYCCENDRILHLLFLLAAQHGKAPGSARRKRLRLPHLVCHKHRPGWEWRLLEYDHTGAINCEHLAELFCFWAGVILLEKFFVSWQCLWCLCWML